MGRQSEDDQLAELAAKLQDIQEQIERLSAFGTRALPVLASIYRERRVRDEVFDMPDLFGEPAWDMLLALARAELEGKRTSVTDLCRESCVPPTTALRWITHMEEIGLIERRDDDRDARRHLLSLTDKARTKLRRFTERMALLRKAN